MRKVVLIPDPESGGYTAIVPSLPGCISEGDTKEEALANITEAIQGFIAVLEEDGLPVPPETEEAVILTEVNA
jgi:predicted RNase H-like HicB family nuclease